MAGVDALLAGLLGLPLTGAAASPEPSASPVAWSPGASPSPAAGGIPGLVLAPGARIGADPPLREPVQPTGRVLAPDLDRAAFLDERLKSVRFQIWFPDGTAGPGDTLRFHVRITNQGKRTIRLYCPGFNLGTWTLSLFPEVRARTVEADLDRLMFGVQGPGLFTVRITPRPGQNPACEGRAVAARFPLGPGERWTSPPTRCSWRRMAARRCPVGRCTSQRRPVDTQRRRPRRRRRARDQR